jgi:hypothetical protein
MAGELLSCHTGIARSASAFPHFATHSLPILVLLHCSTMISPFHADLDAEIRREQDARRRGTGLGDFTSGGSEYDQELYGNGLGAAGADGGFATEIVEEHEDDSLGYGAASSSSSSSSLSGSLPHRVIREQLGGEGGGGGDYDAMAAYRSSQGSGLQDTRVAAKENEVGFDGIGCWVTCVLYPRVGSFFNPQIELVSPNIYPPPPSLSSLRCSRQHHPNRFSQSSLLRFAAGRRSPSKSRTNYPPLFPSTRSINGAIANV